MIEGRLGELVEDCRGESVVIGVVPAKLANFDPDDVLVLAHSTGDGRRARSAAGRPEHVDVDAWKLPNGLGAVLGVNGRDVGSRVEFHDDVRVAGASRRGRVLGAAAVPAATVPAAVATAAAVPIAAGKGQGRVNQTVSDREHRGRRCDRQKYDKQAAYE